MNTYIKALFITSLMISFVAASGSYSYFSDVENSAENLFTTGTWCNQSSCFIVDTTHTDLTSHGHGNGKGAGYQKDLHNTWLINDCDRDIVLSDICVEWNSDNVPLIEIVIRGHTCWEGEAYTGTIEFEEIVSEMLMTSSSPDFEDYILESKFPKEHITFWFADAVDRETFEFVYTMSDGSTKYVRWPDEQLIW